MSQPIRILQVVTHMNRGGLETMLMNYYRQIDRSRVQFDFLVHRAEEAAYDGEIEALGGMIHRLPRLVPWSRRYNRTLEDFFRTHPEYRIVHVHQDCLSGVILKAAKNQGIPVRIAHSHNASQDRDLKYPIKLFYRRWIPKFATDLFACGKNAGDWMFSGAPYTILNNAIDSGAYRYDPEQARKVRRSLGISENTLVVGHVGRFSPQKNHDFLLEIFASLVRQRSDARLLLVGDGPLRRQMEEKAEQLGIRDKVLFTGVRSDVPALMQAMDVFVFPSHYEGLPVTMVEAQAAGLPCLISHRVPPECRVTELVKTVSLEQSPEFWARNVLEAAGMPRQDTGEKIRAAGFDIGENARWLETYYCNIVRSR